MLLLGHISIKLSFMKNGFPRLLITSFTAVLLMLLPLYFTACSTDNDAKSNKILTSDQAEKAVRDLEKQEIEAILNKDLETLKKIWDPEFTVNSPLLHKLVGRDQVLAMAQNDIISYEKFERNIERVTFLDGVVITMGEETIIPQNNNPGAGNIIKRRFTNVWHYKNGNWVETNRHAHIIVPQEETK